LHETLIIVKSHIEKYKQVELDLLREELLKWWLHLLKNKRGTDVIKDLIQKYGSENELERLFNQTNNRWI